jgi:hypothetical protein
MAFVLSSVSGNLISAASAGYAPTNGGDVSAIASAYQVVSVTSTELYAGTAFLTGVNGAPISAERAGHAANASLANSAWYDGTGRLISSLPGSSEVSSIASSYAEAAVSGKADASSLSSYALSSDVSGVIDTVSANSASWGGGATGNYVETSATEVTIGSGNTAKYTSFVQGGENSASGTSLAQGGGNTSVNQSLVQGYLNSAKNDSMAQGIACTAMDTAFAQGSHNSAKSFSFAQGTYNSAVSDSFVHGSHSLAKAYSFAQGQYVSASATAAAFGRYNLRGNGNTSIGDSAAFVLGDGTGADARHDLMVVTKNGEITMYSSTADEVGTGIMSSIRAISAAATGGGVDSATVSAIASSYAESAASGKLDASASSSFYTTANESGFVDSAYVNSAVSSKLDTTAFNSGDFYSTANPSGFVDSAYVNSAVSSKLDASASSSFYSTSNPSSFITGVDLSPYQTTADMSGYIPTSMSSDFQQVTGMSSYALSADVSATVDLVGTQSANWGGSALALSAGPGVRLEKVGNTLVAGLDETVLWSGNPEKTTTTAKTYSLSEDLRNFARYRVVVNPHEQSAGAIQRPCQEFTLNLEYNPTSTPIYAQFPAYTIGGNILTINYWYLTGAEGTCTSLGLLAGVRQTNATVTTGITAYSGSIVKIVGINRTAGV